MSLQVSKNIFWLTASRVAALLMLFFAYTQLFRYLGPFMSGQYQFILSYVLIFSTVVDFGIQQFITKKMSENPERTREYFYNFISFEIVVAGLLYVFLVLIAFFRHQDSAVFYGVCLAGLGMVANALTYPYLSVLAAHQDLRKVAWINFLNSCVNVSVIFTAIAFGKSIVFLASVQLIFGVLDIILYRQLVKKYLPNLGDSKTKNRKLFDFVLIKNILFNAWPFALLVGFSAIYNRIDVVIITYLKGYIETGYYTAAYKIFDLLGFFPSVVSYTLFPFLAALMAKNAIADVRYNLEKYIRLMIAAALPMAVGGTLLATKLIELIAGKEYAHAGPILQILIWAPAVLFVYIPVNALVISQLTKKAAAITSVNVILNISGNIILIPYFGIKAAALMTVISETLQGVFYFYFVKKNITDFDILKFLPKPVFAAVAMGVILWYVRNGSLIISLILGLIVYVSTLTVLGFFKKQDLHYLNSLFVK